MEISLGEKLTKVIWVEGLRRTRCTIRMSTARRAADGSDWLYPLESQHSNRSAADTLLYHDFHFYTYRNHMGPLLALNYITHLSLKSCGVAPQVTT